MNYEDIDRQISKHNGLTRCAVPQGGAIANGVGGPAVTEAAAAEAGNAARKMGQKMRLGIGFEFIRHADKTFEYGVEKAAELGYEYIEPWVHWGRDMLSESFYNMSVSMLDDPYRIKRACEKAGVKVAALSSHTCLAKPEIGTEYLKQAVRFAAEIGAPVVTTSEGRKPDWTTEAEDFVLMRYTLCEALKVAEPRGVSIGLEPHHQYSKTPDGLDRIYRLVDSPALGINFDTGNAYLCGHDPVSWLERCKDRLVHLHAKDISLQKSKDKRGKVTGTPAGCACGEGLIDWKKVIAICKSAPRDITMCVECGTEEEAARSIAYLKSLM